MSQTENLIRATDFIVFLKGIKREWIAYPESGKIFSTVTGEFMKPSITRGYYSLPLTLTTSGKRYKSSIKFHRALWILTYGIPLSLRAEIDHIDGNKENNKISNLRLVSKEENTPHKLNFEIAEEIRKRYVDGETQTALGKEFGVSRQAIQHIIYGRSYKHLPEKMHYRGHI